MEDYYFIYKDSLGALNSATNPRFIAEHKSCIALNKQFLPSLGYKRLSDLLYSLNWSEVPETFMIEIRKTDLVKLLGEIDG